MKPGRTIRCAIYTRKSSEEGLDQTFNSLDAQREACEAYIASQRHEGWQALPAQYDDGGFSGGSLVRPALQRLLGEITNGTVDLVVVYKIDRLTRSLADFSKMVEVFDRHSTSFVSITQHFNTTTSMGRLTLNVLLSFAQFEREVTGERIRDKIAASKRKGMWMGGTVPLGYVAKDRKLVINEVEAARVRHLFERYQALGCVGKLEAELHAAGVRGRGRTTRAGIVIEAKPFSHGALYLLLKNRIYLGDIGHKGAFYPGQHEAIVPLALWEAVQNQMESNREARQLGTRAKEASLLAGMVMDSEGIHLTPSHTVKTGRRYRYYIGRMPKTMAGRATAQIGQRLCVPAHDLERLVTNAWLKLLVAPDLDVQLGVEAPDIGQQVRVEARRIHDAWETLDFSSRRRAFMASNILARVARDETRVSVSVDALRGCLQGDPTTSYFKQNDVHPNNIVIIVEASVIRMGGEMRILGDDDRELQLVTTKTQQALLRAIAQGREWHRQLLRGEAESLAELGARHGVSQTHVARSIRCAWLAPDIVEALIEGRASPKLTLASVRGDAPKDWNAQRQLWAR